MQLKETALLKVKSVTKQTYPIFKQNPPGLLLSNIIAYRNKELFCVIYMIVLAFVKKPYYLVKLGSTGILLFRGKFVFSFISR